MQIFTISLLDILCCSYFFALSSVQSAGQVTIYRDTYGVPHIYGESEEAVAFAHGYVQAEDRLETLLKAYRKAEGTMAEAFGEDFVEHDYQQRLLRHAKVSKRRYNELSEQSQKSIEYFLAGVKTYMRKHPDEVPEWAPEPQPYHVVALSRYVVWGWHVGQAMAELNRAEPGPDEGKGSNQWVIGRNRSAENCVIACIDPHVGWNDEWLFYESHLQGGDLHVFGFNLVGVPGVGLGHNEYLSWAMTTGGPDVADVYEEKINPQNPLQYEYDGEWRDIKVETVEIKVKTGEGYNIAKREIHRTHHGPIVERRGNKAYAIKLAQENEVHLVDQMSEMNKAKNLGEFLQAVSPCQLMPQNLMYGDVYGNMYYVRTGRVPIRPKGYDWSRPVPGNTSKTEWLGIHNAEDLVQILNPPAGFMQNCNISPGTMTFKSPMTADRYLDYLYQALTDGSNSRGRRFLELMKEEKKVTKEEAIQFALDTHIHGVGVWQKALVDAYEAHKGDSKELSKAIDIIKNWDGSAEVESKGMTLFYFFWLAGRKIAGNISLNAIEPGKTLSSEVQGKMLKALKQAVEYTQEHFNSIEVPWGDVHRGKRGDNSWGLAGVAKHGLETLRAIGTSDPNENGISYARSGQSCPTVVLLKQPITSYSAVPYGQSEKPDSPHYLDQAEKLFSKKKLKPTWFQKEELMKNLESTTVIEIEGKNSE